MTTPSTTTSSNPTTTGGEDKAAAATGAGLVSIRPGKPSDAPALVELLNAIIEKGGTTACKTPFTTQKMMDTYLNVQPNNRNKPGIISCQVAVVTVQKQQDDGTEAAQEEEKVVGFQGLEWFDPNWDDDGFLHLQKAMENSKEDNSWAIIATFVALDSHGKGVGRKLFEATKAVAKNVNVKSIDATIKVYNTGGQAYYKKMGFHDYHQTDIAISKRYDL